MASKQDNTLAKWLGELLEADIAVLNGKYKNDDDVKAEMERLPMPKTRSSHVSEEILYRLRDKLHGQPCEPAVWDAVLWYLAHPLPLALGHDLLDRCISVVSMAFTRQVDEVQWRLATLVEDALYTLIRERYQMPQYSVAQFKTMLDLYAWRNDGVLYMLSFYETPDPKKRAVYEAAVVEEENDRREKLESSEE